MMKQFLYSLILFSSVFPEVYAKNIDSLRNVFEQSEQLDSSYYKAFNELNWQPRLSNIDTIVKHAWEWYKTLQ